MAMPGLGLDFSDKSTDQSVKNTTTTTTKTFTFGNVEFGGSMAGLQYPFQNAVTSKAWLPVAVALGVAGVAYAWRQLGHRRNEG